MSWNGSVKKTWSVNWTKDVCDGASVYREDE